MWESQNSSNYLFIYYDNFEKIAWELQISFWLVVNYNKLNKDNRYKTFNMYLEQIYDYYFYLKDGY